MLVGERAGGVVGWARVAPYSPRACYSGVVEGSVYVLARERGRGLGSALVAALCEEAERAGFHKIVGRLFADNESSRRLVAKHGFREVGTHLRHGRLDGDWRDVLVVELLLGEAADYSPAAAGPVASILHSWPSRSRKRARFVPHFGLIGREHNLGAPPDGALEGPVDIVDDKANPSSGFARRRRRARPGLSPHLSAAPACSTAPSSCRCATSSKPSPSDRKRGLITVTEGQVRDQIGHRGILPGPGSADAPSDLGPRDLSACERRVCGGSSAPRPPYGCPFRL